MLVESVLKDIELHGLVQVFEEDFSQVVAFADDDGIFRIQVTQAGKSRSEHGMRRHVTETAFFIEFFQSRLYRSDIADDTVFGQYGQHLAESLQSIFYRGGVDYQLRFKLLDFFQRSETVGVIDKAQLMRVDVKHGRLVLKT